MRKLGLCLPKIDEALPPLLLMVSLGLCGASAQKAAAQSLGQLPLSIATVDEVRSQRLLAQLANRELDTQATTWSNPDSGSAGFDLKSGDRPLGSRSTIHLRKLMSNV